MENESGTFINLDAQPYDHWSIDYFFIFFIFILEYFYKHGNTIMKYVFGDYVGETMPLLLNNMIKISFLVKSRCLKNIW